MIVDAHNHLVLSHADWDGAALGALPVDAIVERLREGGVAAAGLIVGGDRAFPDREASPWDGTIGALAQFWRGMSASHGPGLPILSADDVDRISIETPGFLLGVEGASPLLDSPLGNPVAAFHLLARLGVRSLQLLGGEPRPVFEADPPLRLSETGRLVLGEAKRLGFVADLSHLSGDEPAFTQIIDALGRPPIASHHSCRAVNGHPRALSDAAIRRIAASGGVVGIHCGSGWLNGEDRQGTTDDFVRHVQHVAALVGAEHVAIGSDHLDVRAHPADLRGDLFMAGFEGPESFGLISDVLERTGFTAKEQGRILGENVLRVWRSALASVEAAL